MEIKVLGTGCPKCTLLYRYAESAIAQSGQAATLTKVEAIEDIAAHGVMSTPALVIDGRVVSAGHVPTAAAITTLIKEAASAVRP